MAYQIKLEQFQGPLDVLLQLIEQQELDITNISLSEITESFLEYLTEVEELYPEELADFLVIATRLIYLKSRLLLPFLTPDEEEPVGQLSDHLKIYKEFRDAAAILEQQILQRQFALARPVATARLEAVEFTPPRNVTTTDLRQLYTSVVDRLETIITIPAAAIRKAITLKEKVTALYQLLKQNQSVHFSKLVQQQTDRLNIVLTFLALLELIKQNDITVEQTSHFSDMLIVCQKTTAAS